MHTLFRAVKGIMADSNKHLRIRRVPESVKPTFQKGRVGHEGCILMAHCLDLRRRYIISERQFWEIYIQYGGYFNWKRLVQRKLIFELYVICYVFFSFNRDNLLSYHAWAHFIILLIRHNNGNGCWRVLISFSGYNLLYSLVRIFRSLLS